MRLDAVARAGLCLLAIAAVAASGCGSDPPRVSDADATSIYSALQESQIFGRGTCSNVSHPLGDGTRRAYAVLARVARANPDAVLPDPDFPDAERPIGEKASGVAGVIRYCLAEVATEGPGWRALADRLNEAAALRGPVRSN